VSGAAPRVTASPEATAALGAALAPALAAGDVLVLSGELGAGKTRFVAGLAAALAPGAHVRSPSFTLVNEYGGEPEVVHLDLYRLGTGEVDALGLEEYAPRAVLVVEWGERLPAAWRADALELEFTLGEGDTRAIAARGHGPRGTALFAAWRALP